MTELDKGPQIVKAPLVVEDTMGSSLPPAVEVALQITHLEALSFKAMAKVGEWSRKGQLIYEFHWYASTLTQASLDKYYKGAQTVAYLIGNPPIYLGEFWAPTTKESAEWLGYAISLGIHAATYWQFVDTNFTGTDGWYIYPPGISKNLFDFTEASEVNWAQWDTYSKSVANNTYWGAYICGSGGGHMGVLAQVPEMGPPPLRSMAPGEEQGNVSGAPGLQRGGGPRSRAPAHSGAQAR